MAQNQGPQVVSMSQVKSFLGKPATTSHYQVYFLPPQKVINHLRNVYNLSFESNQELIYLSCMNTVLPGSSFMTHEITNDFSGITEKHAYRREYDGDIEMTFMVDSDYTSIRIFEGWMGFIGGETSGFDRKTKTSSYRVPLPEDYKTDSLQVIKFEKNFGRSVGGGIDGEESSTSDNSSMTYTFLNAFPIALNSVPISYNGSEMLSVSVRMSYSRYYIDHIRSDSTGALPGTNQTITQRDITRIAFGSDQFIDIPDINTNF